MQRRGQGTPVRKTNPASSGKARTAGRSEIRVLASREARKGGVWPDRVTFQAAPLPCSTTGTVRRQMPMSVNSDWLNVYMTS